MLAISITEIVLNQFNFVIILSQDILSQIELLAWLDTCILGKAYCTPYPVMSLLVGNDMWVEVLLEEIKELIKLLLIHAKVV